MDLSLINEIPYFMTRWYTRVKETPEKVLLVDGATGEMLTANELEQLSGRVYAYLKAQNVGADDFVMIDMPRGIHMVVCMLGVWKAGAAFTAVEDDYAPDRIAYIRHDVKCRVFLDQALYNDIQKGDYEEGFTEADDHSAAFAVYTSGTTGFPKGVLHEYGNIKLNSLSARVKTGRRVFPESRYAQISPFNFVASVKIVLSLIQVGFTMYVIPYDIVKNPSKLKQYYLENKISVSFLSPSILRIIGKDLGPDMKYVFTGSEPANGLSLDGIGLVNTYSMSEGAFTLTQFVIDKPYDICPVGKPNNDNIKLYILDENGNELPNGEVGEIAFENPFMRGYINLPEETAKVMKNGLYHTGDLGKKLPDGNLILVGRANDMIKINGNRIEPAEIEKAFKQATDASWCCAKGFEETDRSYICLYYTDALSFDEKEMKEKLGASLPYYMIPSYYVHIDEIPLLPNGKVNKKALASPDRKTYSAEYVPPTDELEKKLCDAAAKVLRTERVGIDDDFYQLGGDSLATMALLAEADLDELTAADVYRGSVIRKIAQLYREKLASGDSLGLAEKELAARKNTYPLTGTQYKIFQSQMTEPEKAMWGLSLTYQLDDVSNAQRICDAVNRVIREYPIFSTVVEYDDSGVPVQHIDPSVITPISVIDLNAEEFETVKQTFAGVYKMIGCPLYKGAVYRVDNSVAYLFLEFHHIIVDGSSFGVLHKAMYAAYNDEPMPLDTFYSYLDREYAKKSTAGYADDEKYFAEKYGNMAWDAGLAPDKQDQRSGVNKKVFMLKGISTQSLEDFEKKKGFSKNALFVLAALLAQRECNKADSPLMNWIFHNRTDPISQQTMGIVYKHLPVGLTISDSSTASELLTEIKRQSNNGIRHAECDWIAEHERVPENDSTMFVYETQNITSGGIPKKMGLSQFWIPYNQQASIFRFVVQIYDMPDVKYLLLFYMTQFYSEELVAEYGLAMKKALYGILSSGDLKTLTVKELFEKQEGI